MSRKSWYEFRNLAESEVEVSIYDSIGFFGVSAADFANELKRHSGKNLTVRINSPGGSVTEGYAIFNALKRHSGKVTTYIDGLAASMASYIALAGESVKMAENGFFMIHNVSGMAGGDSKALRRMADVMDKMQANLVHAYSVKTGKSDEELERLMDEETWFSAQEAKDFGFIDEITEPLEMAASFDLSGFRNAPRVDTQKQAMDQPTVTASLALDASAFNASLAEAGQNLEAFVSKLSAAQAQAQKNFSDLQAVTKERDDFAARVTGLEKQLSSRAGEITDLNNKLNQAAQDFQAYKEAEGPRFNALLQAELAKSGHPEPVPAASNDNPLNPEQPKNELKGLKKVQAAFAAEAAAKRK